MPGSDKDPNENPEGGTEAGAEVQPADAQPGEGGEKGGDIAMPDKGGPPPIDFNQPLPEIINMERMGRISDVKAIWRAGIKQIEEIFADHVARINDLFDDRALEYDKVRDQLITNHEWLK